ncbi:hypothetical protein [Phenylobacterium sp. 58.2.17]|uniref:hypothetical protein n=1 Tax=Phenylobacterium sp. 58.2.17 TaxID=2969306 RepID=UPI002263C211|nr:hypothetical protein [Phenylobacterium sp. 58.2.17]MCX7588525.1 hypothetical protein [Phenylobacterium sp. 58.2.17]
MAESIERFLRRRPTISTHAPLGRVFNVLRETWRLDDDPKRTTPDSGFIATGRTAAEAADLAREWTGRYARHGFDKASGAWWAVEGAHIHRITVGPRRRRSLGLALGLGAAGLAAVLVARGASGRRADR